MDKVQRTETGWREMLTPDEYRVLRQAGTEAPWTGEYTGTKTGGLHQLDLAHAGTGRGRVGSW